MPAICSRSAPQICEGDDHVFRGGRAKGGCRAACAAVRWPTSALTTKGRVTGARAPPAPVSNATPNGSRPDIPRGLKLAEGSQKAALSSLFRPFAAT
jgi:hypothetical protein